jgi:hypothetical protein
LAQPTPTSPAAPQPNSVAKAARPTPPAGRTAGQTAAETKRHSLAALLLDFSLLLALALAVGSVFAWERRRASLAVVTASAKDTSGSPSSSDDGIDAPPISPQQEPAPRADGAAREATGDAAGPVEGVYAWRTRPDRASWLSARGGTPESERAVEFGLEWLVRHQADEGFWSNSCVAPEGSNPHARCDARAACPGAGKAVEMAHTGLALLALQGSGNYDANGNPYSENVARAIRWIIGHQGEDGALIGSLNAGKRLFPDYMYEHGIATLALTEACAVAVASGRQPGEGHAKAVEAAVRFIEHQQHDDGGWRYTADKSLPSDTSISSWQMFALWSAREAGIAVDEACLAKAVEFYQRCETGQDGRTAYLAGRGVGTEATTGAGMWVHLFLRRQPDSPLVQAAAPCLAGFAEKTYGSPESRPKYNDFYLWHHCSLPMARLGGASWDRWNRSIRETLIELQQTEGCSRGSWDSETSMYGRGAGGAGRIYTTALAILTLEVYYRYAAE